MIEIDVVIKMGEDCEKRMTLDEARNLYSELNRMFNSGQRNDIPTFPASAAPDLKKPSTMGQSRIDEAKAEAGRNREGGCGCGKKKDPTKKIGRPATRRITEQKIEKK